jgi:hypothetical protein
LPRPEQLWRHGAGAGGPQCRCDAPTKRERDSGQLTENNIYNEPKTDEERIEVASAYQINLDIHMPMLVDRIDNDVDKKYIRLPRRMFPVDGSGRIAFAGKKARLAGTTKPSRRPSSS